MAARQEYEVEKIIAKKQAKIVDPANPNGPKV